MDIKAQGFNIDELDNDVVVTHKCSVVEDADGESVCGFILVGKNSPEHQNAANAVRVGNIQRAGKRKTQLDTATAEGASIVSKTVAKNDRTIALAVVTGWYGFMSGGKEMPFNKELVEKMFDKYPQWQVKVLADLDIEANFMKVSSAG